MKKLSDYQGEEAIDLWAELIEPISVIVSDSEIAKIAKGNISRATLAKEILKRHKKEATEILLAIDNEPINAINIVLRTISLLNEISQYDEIMDFFALSGQKIAEESSGSVTENIKGNEN